MKCLHCAVEIKEDNLVNPFRLFLPVFRAATYPIHPYVVICYNCMGGMIQKEKNDPWRKLTREDCISYRQKFPDHAPLVDFQLAHGRFEQ